MSHGDLASMRRPRLSLGMGDVDAALYQFASAALGQAAEVARHAMEARARFVSRTVIRELFQLSGIRPYRSYENSPNAFGVLPSPPSFRDLDRPDQCLRRMGRMARATNVSRIALAHVAAIRSQRTYGAAAITAVMADASSTARPREPAKPARWMIR